MKNRKQAAWITAIPAIVVTFFVGTHAAHAGETLIGKVPFEFSVGEKTFPAGEYAFEVDRVSPGTVLVRSTESSTSAIVLAHRGGNTVSAGAPVMQFNVYGEKRFVSLIRTSKDTAVSLGHGSQESALAKAGVQPTVALVRPTASRYATRF